MPDFSDIYRINKRFLLFPSLLFHLCSLILLRSLLVASVRHRVNSLCSHLNRNFHLFYLHFAPVASNQGFFKSALLYARGLPSGYEIVFPPASDKISSPAAVSHSYVFVVRT